MSDMTQRDESEVVDLTETQPLGELVAQATADLTKLMRKEVELAKAELTTDLNQAKRGGVLFGTAGALAYLTLLMLSFAAAWGLASIMPAGWAFAIVGVVYGVAAFIAYRRAKREMANFSPAPEQTIETLKEDVQWAKHPTN